LDWVKATILTIKGLLKALIKISLKSMVKSLENINIFQDGDFRDGGIFPHHERWTYFSGLYRKTLKNIRDLT